MMLRKTFKQMKTYKLNPWIFCEDMLINPVDELDEQDTIRNAHNQSCPILKLPEEMRILIYSYLRCPIRIYPEFVQPFNESMKNYPLDLHFSFISSIQNTIPLKPSKDIAKLMKLDNKFLNEGFDQLLSARTSYFTLDSPLFVGQMVRFIYKIFLGLQQVTEFDKLANEMTRSKYFESYLTFLKLVPDYKYRFYDIDFVFGFIKFLKKTKARFFLIWSLGKIIPFSYCVPETFI